MFCTQCGQKLAGEARFCSNCGRNVSVAAANPAPAAPQQPGPAVPPVQPQDRQVRQPAGEQVLLVLRASRKHTLFKITPCCVVFMLDKIVVAHLSKAMQKAENDRLSQEIKASGKGFLKGSASMMSYWAQYHEKYYQMSSQQILAEDPENVMIFNQSVTELFFHAYDTHLASDGTQQSSGGKMNISFAGGEPLKFTHTIASSSSIRDTLARLFGGSLKYRK